MAAAVATPPALAGKQMNFVVSETANKVLQGTKRGEQIKAFASSPRFHREFTFDSAVTGRNMNVSYGIAGEQPGVPTVLAMGGLYRGRWNAPWVDYLCHSKGVQIIFIDRPGIGRSTPVAVTQRVPFWLETVKQLLPALDIKEVALLGHSAGAIYAFNTLYTMPELLAKNTPLYLLSPWVHPSHSGVKIFTLLRAVPASFMIAAGLRTLLRLGKDKFSRIWNQDERARTKEKLLRRGHMLQATCGLTVDEASEYRDFYVKSFFNEPMAGCNDEATLCLNADAEHWGACADYPTFFDKLVDKLRAQQGEARTKLEVQAYFGQRDFFIGQGGIDYFNGLFTSAKIKESIAYSTETINDFDHDDACLPENRYLGKILGDIAARQAAIVS